MTLTAQEIAAKLDDYNRWRRGITEETSITPRELGLVIEAAIALLEKHPTERQWVPETFPNKQTLHNG
jgi:hypothetical protein